MTSWIPPAFIFILGAFLVPFLRGRAKQACLLLIPVLAFINLLSMPEGTNWTLNFLGYEIVFDKVDKLSMAFGYIFTIVSFIANLYALRVKDDGQHIAALLYAGGALGVVFAGDMLSLFVFWEIMTISSLYLIWAKGTEASYAAGLRYLCVHLFGGLCLLTGIIIHVHQTGSIAFGVIGLNGLSSYLILIGFVLNAAVPPLHAWLVDAYPEATITGAVFLSAFTTKTAVYVLIRAFPGTEILVWLGGMMAIYGVIYAVLENDIRRLLAYHIISQVGYMVAGVGIGSMMGINGAAAHAFSNILYKGLLFMVAGAVIHMTGKSKLTELGGLHKTMPVTFTLCLVAGLSISAFPFFNGFISKSMVVTAAAEEHLGAIWLMLMFASSGTFLSVGLKFTYFIFLGHDSGLRPKEPPLNMLIAMGLAGFLCIFIGVYPYALYKVLPHDIEYSMYTVEHVVLTLQILLFTGLAFFVFLKQVKPKEGITLDIDWFYRKGGKALLWLANRVIGTDRDDKEKIIRES